MVFLACVTRTNPRREKIQKNYSQDICSILLDDLRAAVGRNEAVEVGVTRGLSGDLFDSNWPQPVIANFLESLLLLLLWSYITPRAYHTKRQKNRPQPVIVNFAQRQTPFWTKGIH